METEDPDIVQQLRIMIQYTNAVAGTICSKGADEIERLRTLGDALAATGGQHGFDEALDNWKEMRGE
jgi:hypothetical protein